MSKTDQAVSNVYYFLRWIIMMALSMASVVKIGPVLGFLSVFVWIWVVRQFMPDLTDKVEK